MASILVAWVGEEDIRASEPGTVTQSRIHQVVAGEFYSTVVLLTSQTKKIGRSYRKWLANKSGVNVELDRRKLVSEHDLPEVYRATVNALEECASRYIDEDVEFSFLLGADSPVMDAVLILLAHTRYAAELIHWTRKRGALALDLPSGDVLALLQGQTPGVALKRPLSETASFAAFVHRSEAMETVINRASRMAVVDVPVLITGEGGTGRELLARAVHKASTRSKGAFVPVVCGALSIRDQEEILFGSGARPGALQRAQNGTVYLDCLDQLHPSTQTALYQVMREGSIISNDEEIQLSVRIIASTTHNIRSLVPAGKVLEGLFNELAIGIIEIPPLRERDGDLDLIVNYLLDMINEELGQERTISDSARARLRQHNWPGNVGELKAVLRRAAVWSEQEIHAEHIDSSILPIAMVGANDDVLNRELEGFEINSLLDDIAKHYIGRALNEASGNKTKAARLLGLNNYQTLTNWMTRLGVN